MIPPILLEAALFNLAASILAWLLGSVRRSGAIVGFLVGFTVYLGTGLEGWTILLLFFVVGSGATRLGSSLKKELGAEQPLDGRRGALEAMAKAGVPFLLSLVLCFLESDLLLLAYCGGLSAALADTLGSEIGPLTGGIVRRFPTLQKVPAGTPGGISLGGTIAALLGSFFIAIAADQLLNLDALLAITVAGFFASFIDSLISARFQGGILGHHAGNLFACSCGAALAITFQYLSMEYLLI